MKSKDLMLLGVAGVGLYFLTQPKQQNNSLLTLNIPPLNIPPLPSITLPSTEDFTNLLTPGKNVFYEPEKPSFWEALGLKTAVESRQPTIFDDFLSGKVVDVSKQTSEPLINTNGFWKASIFDTIQTKQSQLPVNVNDFANQGLPNTMDKLFGDVSYIGAYFGWDNKGQIYGSRGTLEQSFNLFQQDTRYNIYSAKRAKGYIS